MTGLQARFLREKLGLGVKDFARLVSVSWGAVYQWERHPERPLRARVARARLRLLWIKHVKGPESWEEALTALVEITGVTDGEAALLLGRYGKAEGESWGAAVERIARREERRLAG